jgi:hypothetical protein
VEIFPPKQDNFVFEFQNKKCIMQGRYKRKLEEQVGAQFGLILQHLNTINYPPFLLFPSFFFLLSFTTR